MKTLRAILWALALLPALLLSKTFKALDKGTDYTLAKINKEEVTGPAFKRLQLLGTMLCLALLTVIIGPLAIGAVVVCKAIGALIDTTVSLWLFIVEEAKDYGRAWKEAEEALPEPVSAVELATVANTVTA